MLQEVDFDIALSMENFVAHWATGNLLEPAVNALVVEDVEAAKHSTRVVVRDGAQANDAVTHKVLFVFHPDQNGLNLPVSLLWECLLDSKWGARDKNLPG